MFKRLTKTDVSDLLSSSLANFLVRKYIQTINKDTIAPHEKINEKILISPVSILGLWMPNPDKTPMKISLAEYSVTKLGNQTAKSLVSDSRYWTMGQIDKNTIIKTTMRPIVIFEINIYTKKYY